MGSHVAFQPQQDAWQQDAAQPHQIGLTRAPGLPRLEQAKADADPRAARFLLGIALRQIAQSAQHGKRLFKAGIGIAHLGQIDAGLL